MSRLVGKLIARASADIDRLDAELLLAHATSKDRAFLAAHPEHKLSISELWRFLRNVRRAQLHEPIAYITGHKAFFGLDFAVDSRVLIPRPETELMVERALEILTSTPHHVIDVGTGSGCIAISIAVRSPKTTITATDVSNDALAIAKHNAQQHKVDTQITFVQNDLLNNLNHESLSDLPLLFTMNLPYISTAQYKTLQPNVKNFEPKLALESGDDGLDLYRKIFAQIATLQKKRPEKSIRLLCEIDPSQTQHIKKTIHDLLPYRDIAIHQDLAGHDRMVEIALTQFQKSHQPQ